MFDPADFGKTEEAEVSPDLLDRIKIASARAERLAFWKNRCLVKSLAAYRMLKRRGINASLHLGFAASPDNNPVAHAWLQVADFEVVPKGQVEVELFSKAQ